MKKASLILTAALLSCVVFARPQGERADLIMADATSLTNTITGVVGYLDEVQVCVTDGVSTGTVVVSVQPTDATVAAYNIATNTVTDESIWYPVRDYTTVAGVALTSDQPARYMLYGDIISVVVSGSPTGKTWRCRIKYDDGQ